MTVRAPLPAFSEAKLARHAAELGFGRRLGAWIHAAGAEVKATAEHSLGMSRNDLNDCIQGVKHFRAACLELLPPAVELLFLRERAAHHAMMLRPVANTEETFAEAVATFGTCLATLGASEADGYVDANEALRDLQAIEDLEQRLANVKSHRRSVLAERGRMIRSVTGGRT